MGLERARPRSPDGLAAEGESRAKGVELGGSETSVSPRNLTSPTARERAVAHVVDAGALDPAARHQSGARAAAEIGRAHTPTPPPADRSPITSDDANSPMPALPCLSSNNSIEQGTADPLAEPEKPAFALSQQAKKSACALAWNVQHMAEKFGLHRLGFLTLTFADHVLSPKEAQRRFNSLRTNVLSDRYEAFLRVLERQKSGRIHYHLLVVLPFDARTGVDFEAFGSGSYKSASVDLRNEWSFWRKTAKAYRFGRTELMPIRSTEEGIGRYVGKYISKHHAVRKFEDRGVRLVEYSSGARMARTRFGWCTAGGAEWRAKVRLFAQIMGERDGRPIYSIDELSTRVDPHWAHWHRAFIASLPLVTAPPGHAYDAAGRVYRLSDGLVVVPSAHFDQGAGEGVGGPTQEPPHPLPAQGDLNGQLQQ